MVVSDSEAADPRALTATSLFTVTIGDENDNDMRPGASSLSVFNFEVGWVWRDGDGGDDGGEGMGGVRWWKVVVAVAWALVVVVV